MKINEVTLSEMNHIFAKCKPTGLFIAEGQGAWLAMDNRYGHPIEMGFKTKEKAIAWLEAAEPQKEKPPCEGDCENNLR